MTDVKFIFDDFFSRYCSSKNYRYLTYVITSTFRKGNPKTNPHAVKGNAMDITLRYMGDYAGIKEYNKLFVYMLENWPYRAGIDNTHGNIHIHLDLGRTRPQGQEFPYFFKEDNCKWQKEIKTEKDLI